MIEGREGLIEALHEAAELEHGLMLQYLFAALSLKKSEAEGLSPAAQELARNWEGRVLAVAREEMAHLGTVCNLLTAIGGAPRFERPNFPQAAKTTYPFAFSLTRYSDEALYRFIRFELPKGERAPAPPGLRALEAFLGPIEPEPLEYEYIGQLYGQIRTAFMSMPEEALFIGPKYAQDTEEWSRRMQILRVLDRKTASAAIDFIVQQGEGAPANRQGSHYATFLELRAELVQAGADPARAVVANPRTRPHRDAPLAGTTMLTHPGAVHVAQALNQIYEAALLMLAQLYAYGGESVGERAALRNAARQTMTMCVRPLAEILTELPAFKDQPTGPRAGPTFELHDGLQLASQAESRWTLLDERLEAIGNATSELGTVRPRLVFVGENMMLIRGNLQRARMAEERL